jgi:hypothetical protein
LTSLILHNDFRRLDQSVLGLFRRLWKDVSDVFNIPILSWNLLVPPAIM